MKKKLLNYNFFKLLKNMQNYFRKHIKVKKYFMNFAVKQKI